MHAYAENASGWYLGASAGRSSSGLTQGDVDALTGQWITLPAERALRRSSNAYKLYGGLRVRPNFSVEAGYVDLGNASFNTGNRYAGCHNLPIPCIVPERPIRGVRGVRSIQLNAVGSLPFGNQFSLLGQVGIVYSEVTLRTYSDFTNSIMQPNSPVPLDISTVTVRQIAPSIGIGVRYAFTPQVSARLYWEQFRDIGDSVKTGAHDVDLLSLGLEYNF